MIPQVPDRPETLPDGHAGAGAADRSEALTG